MPRTRSELTGVVDSYGNIKGIFERRLLTNVWSKLCQVWCWAAVP